MHPSKVHASTKKEDHGINLGFSDIGAPRREPLASPSKKTMPSQNEFEFRFAKPTEDLGPEAQKMMAEIREEAQRIKAELQAKHEEERAKNGDGTSSLLGGRKLAQAKSKVGRYSELHMNEFKKMDSIADHPSAFRAQPGRATPVASQNQKSLKRTQSKANLADDGQSAVKPTIKLVSDNARLDNPSPPKRARQLDSHDTSSLSRPTSATSSRVPQKPSTPSVARTAKFLEQITTPTHASLARSSSNNQITTPNGLPRSPSKMTLASATGLTRSPSKMALAPATGLTRSPLKIALTPGLTKSITMNNIADAAAPPKSESSHRFTDKMKSILRRAGHDKHEAPVPQSNIPTLSKSPSRPNLSKELPAMPTTPSGSQLPRSKSMKSIKHVNFTPTTIARDGAQQSPTPMRSAIPRTKSFASLQSVAYPALPSSPTKALEDEVEKQERERMEKPAEQSQHKQGWKQPTRLLDRPVERPSEQAMEKPAERSIARKPLFDRPAEKVAERNFERKPLFERPAEKAIEKQPAKSLFGRSPEKSIERPVVKQRVASVEYPTLPQAIDSPSPERKKTLQTQPVPGVFTFTHGTQIKFGTPPAKMGFGNTPGEASIRAVPRESIFPTSSMPGAFPTGNNKENNAPTPAVPHGFSNKKRARAASPSDFKIHDAEERSPKKRKQAAAEGQMLATPKLVAEKMEREDMVPKRKVSSPAKKASGRGGSKSPVKKGGLTMSRLIALATPKKRA